MLNRPVYPIQYVDPDGASVTTPFHESDLVLDYNMCAKFVDVYSKRAGHMIACWRMWSPFIRGNRRLAYGEC